MEFESADRLLEAWGRGDKDALDRLMGQVYHELHRMASAVLRNESPSNRTRPTSLVNELYVELQRQGRLETQDQKHFFSIAAYLMRQILVQHARKRNSAKRGSGAAPVEFRELLDAGRPVIWEQQPEQMIAINDALNRLSEFDPLKATIVDLRFFADLSIEDTAKALEISPTSVKRHWAVARVWLHDQLNAGDGAR